MHALCAPDLVAVRGVDGVRAAKKSGRAIDELHVVDEKCAWVDRNHHSS